eukprot:462570_1
MSFFTKKTADVAVIDCFDASVSCKEIRLSNSNTIAQGKRDGVCVAYLSKLVTPIGVYRWTFRLRKVGSPPSLYILEFGKPNMDAIPTAASTPKGNIKAMQKRVSRLESQNKKEMQTIRELSANNKEKQDHIERLKAESRAIKAEILSYKTNVQRGNDSESIITAMQQRIMSLEAKNKKATEIIQELRTSSDSVNERQRKNSKNKQDELTNLEREKKEALERVDRLETENIQLSEANTRMHASNKSLQKQYDDSSTECKELQMELKTVTAKYNAFCRANIDVKNHMNWDSDTIANWIVSLSEEYEAYEEPLCMKLKEEGMDGSLLSELDRK